MDFIKDIFPSDKGEALPILKPDEFELELEPLRKILLKDEIADLQVAVISIAGAFRTGKSFILNFFLRYFKADRVDDWIGSDDDELNDGFNWKSGPQPHTRGILMWSHPFVIESKGNKIAVILMDTQGNFDHKTKKLFNSQIFALSTLISSLQIINIMNQIQKNDLEYLQFFVEFAKFCREKGVEKESQPFQKLLFVVRDWSHIRDYKHGNEGGKSYLQKECKIGTSKGGSSVREDLHNSFRNIDCFLLPYPGQRVDCPDENFKGSLKDIESLFRDNVRKLVEHVFQSVVPKTYNGKVLTGKTLLEHIEQCYKVMKKTNLDLNKTMTELVAETGNSKTRDSCITSFKEKLEKELEQSCGSPDEEFKKRVKLISEEVEREYDGRAFGSPHCIESHEKILREVMRKEEENYVHLEDEVTKQIKQAKAQMNQYIQETHGTKDSNKLQNICNKALEEIRKILGESRKKVFVKVEEKLEEHLNKLKKICTKKNRVIVITRVAGVAVGGLGGGTISAVTVLAIPKVVAASTVAIASGAGIVIGAVVIGAACWHFVKVWRSKQKKKNRIRRSLDQNKRVGINFKTRRKLVNFVVL